MLTRCKNIRVLIWLSIIDVGKDTSIIDVGKDTPASVKNQSFAKRFSQDIIHSGTELPLNLSKKSKTRIYTGVFCSLLGEVSRSVEKTGLLSYAVSATNLTHQLAWLGLQWQSSPAYWPTPSIVHCPATHWWQLTVKCIGLTARRAIVLSG